VSERFTAWDQAHRRHPAEVTVTPAGPTDLGAVVALAGGRAGTDSLWAGLFETDLGDADRVLLLARVGEAHAG
jgi:hypothetical protein